MQGCTREGDKGHECQVRIPEAEQVVPLSVSTLQFEWKTIHHAERVLAGLGLQRMTSFPCIYSEDTDQDRATLSGRLAKGRRA